MRVLAPFRPISRARRSAWLVDWGPVVGYTALVFYSGLIRIGALPEIGVIGSDKLLHALAFGGLALLLLRATRSLALREAMGKRVCLALSVSSSLGALLELLQWFTTYRTADILDWLADTVGAMLALGLCWLAFRWEASAAAATARRLPPSGVESRK